MTWNFASGTTIKIQCDGEDCDAVLETEQTHSKKAIQAIHNSRWKTVVGEEQGRAVTHFCPACARRLK